MKIRQYLLLPALVFLFLSNCALQKATTPYEYALLSAHVYNDEMPQPLPKYLQPFLEFDEDKYKSRLNLNVGDVVDMVDQKEWGELTMYLGSKILARGGYFGRAYINEQSNQVIIAHRGTDIEIDAGGDGGNSIGIQLGDGKLWDALKDLDDDYNIFKGQIPMEQFEAAQYFVEQTKRVYLENYGKEPQIIHTGHSLGAVLAELCAVKAQTKAITFESPGTRPMVSQLDLDSNAWDATDITIYNAEPNQINTLHEQSGKVVPLYDASQITKQGLSDDELISYLKNHPISELIKRFDPKSGNPVK